MSTSNFHSVNASKIFACVLDADFNYQDLMMNLEAAFTNFECDYFPAGSDPHELRSYPSRVITGLGMEKQYSGFNINIEISIIIRSGYFCGCNLDWNCVYLVDGAEVNKVDYAELIKYDIDCSAQMIRRVEAIFNQYSTPLQVAARFSNGETIYERAG